MPVTDRPDHAREVRSALVDARRFCAALGLAKNSKPNGSGLLICCPSHGDRDPSCSVTNGPDGTLRAVCFGCDLRTDALGVIAIVRGLNLRDRDQFREALAEGAQIAGLYQLEAEILDGEVRPERPRVPPPEPRDERTYPPFGEAFRFWRLATEPADDPEVSGYLVGRRIDPELVGVRAIGRVLSAPPPDWARYEGRTWLETGHRLVVRAFDAKGVPWALRGCRVRAGESPKRLPPSGYKSAELCLLNGAAWRMVRGQPQGRVVVVEGEPDFMVWATRTEEPVIGLFSGSWTDGFAAAVTHGARVIIRTHEDDQGERYAQKVIESLKGRCELRRSTAEAA